MSFFNNVEVKTEFESGGGAFEPMPSGTKSKAVIEEAKWDSFTDEKTGKTYHYITVKWSLLGGEFNNRKVFQKIRVRDEDEKKKTKALSMLAAIDANAGGKLVAAGVEPDDLALMSALSNKTMAITLDVWEINDKKGNWVRAVSSAGAQAPQAAPVADTGLDIPF